MPRDPDRQLEQLLRRAGRDAQPTHRGWDRLEERLGATPQREQSGTMPDAGAHGARRRWAWFSAITGVAAMIGVFIGISLYLGSGQQALAQLQPIRVERQDVALTIFNEFEAQRPVLYAPQAQQLAAAAAPEQIRQTRIMFQPMQTAAQGPGGWLPNQKFGMALVKDRRLVFNLQQGENIVRFTDVAATMDPTSVTLTSETDPTGTTVVEQNFEYDLASADALLKRYVDRKVTCIPIEGESIEGFLAAYDPASLVLADHVVSRTPRGSGEAAHGSQSRGTPNEANAVARPRTQTINRAQLRAIQLADMPAGLHVKPTLVWKLRTKTPGRQTFALTYLCGHMKWEANYVALIQPGDNPDGTGDTLDLQSWVTLDNRSGTTFPDSGIKLMAGDVNRVPDPWAPVPPVTWSGFYSEFGDRLGGPADVTVDWAVPAFVEKSFFEYHLYTLNVPATVRDQQIKQLSLKRIEGVPFERRYVFDTQKHQSRPTVHLEFKNDEEHELGLPLPKGNVRVMQADHDGDIQLLGRDEIDHTPRNEDLSIPIGQAFDVTAERREVNVRVPTPQRLNNRRVEEIEFRMRNHKDTPILARCVEHLAAGRNCEVTESTAEWSREDAFTLHFDFTVAPNEEKTIRFALDYEW